MARKLNPHDAQVLFGNSQFAELFPNPHDRRDHQFRLAAAHPLLDDPNFNLTQNDLFLDDDFAPDKWPF